LKLLYFLSFLHVEFANRIHNIPEDSRREQSHKDHIDPLSVVDWCDIAISNRHHRNKRKVDTDDIPILPSLTLNSLRCKPIISRSIFDFDMSDIMECASCNLRHECHLQYKIDECERDRVLSNHLEVIISALDNFINIEEFQESDKLKRSELNRDKDKNIDD
jgi:hypothetical protein